MGGGAADEIIMTSISNPEVLAVCYAQGWCASPNYMYKDEAEAVTDIGIVFRSNTSITHFEELQYFNITIIKSSAFQSCTNLERVIIPQGVTTIEASAFHDNQKLSSINLGNIQNINDLAFYNCNLSSVDISNCLSLGSGVFYKCINLTNIGSVASVTTIDSSTNGTFQDTGLQGSISFQKLQGTNIPNALFSGCQHITSVDFPTLLYTSVGANAFWNCGVVSFAVREGCTTANNHSFSSEYLEYIDLPSSFTTWNGFALWQNKNQKVIVCRATTPPTVGNTTGGQKSFDGIPTTCKLYVPQASISLYEAAAGWDRFVGRYMSIEGSWYETHREIDPNDE